MSNKHLCVLLLLVVAAFFVLVGSIFDGVMWVTQDPAWYMKMIPFVCYAMAIALGFEAGSRSEKP